MPRDVHPVAWWAWALGLAAAASQTTNPWLLALATVSVSVMVVARRTDAPWALSFRWYLYLGLFIVVLRVFFRILFGGGLGTTVVLDLPGIALPSWAAGITLLGPVTRESLLAGLYDGMRLATILICVGAANALANPRRLLAALPAALYEVGTALVVALAVFPQLAESLERVRRARRLRGDPAKGTRGLRSLLVPVLEDALERSVKLAASMDVRGYGRSGKATRAERRLTGTLLVGGLVGLCVGTYAFLDASAPRLLAVPMLVLGVLLAGGGFLAAGRRVQRTTYRPDPWRLPETLTAASGVAAAVLMVVVARTSPEVLVPDVAVAPTLSVLSLVAVLVGLLPLVGTPAPLMTTTGSHPEADPGPGPDVGAAAGGTTGRSGAAPRQGATS
jgi:energy-coupling factor transport system permease protein